jgi:hypothetical protein
MVVVLAFGIIALGTDEHTRAEDQRGDEHRGDSAHGQCGDSVGSIQSAPPRPV